MTKILSILYLLSFSCRCLALTYFIDQSFDNHLGFGGRSIEAINEVKRMAATAKARLENNGDQAMAQAFRIIFKTDKSNFGAFTTVRNILGTISGMTSAANQASADVRIYADNDNEVPNGRWQLLPDPDNCPEDQKQANKPFDQQIYWDGGNKVMRRPGSRGVRDHGDWGQTYSTPLIVGNQDFFASHGQSRGRASITLSDDLMAAADPHLIEDLDEEDELTEGSMSDYDVFVSVALFHELCHAPNGGNLHPGDAYDYTGWTDIMSANNNLNLPDAYAFIGVVALLMEDFDVRLARDDNAARRGELESLSDEAPAQGSGSQGSDEMDTDSSKRKRSVLQLSENRQALLKRLLEQRDRAPLLERRAKLYIA